MDGRLNTKDLIAGGLLVGLALFGLFINGGLFGLGLEQHSIGSARRMGPGYMPMLVFWLLLGLGALVFLIGLRNGPDPLERWTRLDLGSLLLGSAVALVLLVVLERAGVAGGAWRQLGFAALGGLLVMAASKPWRPLALVHAAMAVFALSLEPFGLMVTVALTVLVAAFADDTHRPLGVLGCIAFLAVLCWFVFIRELDIRVPLWPTISFTAAAPAPGG